MGQLSYAELRGMNCGQQGLGQGIAEIIAGIVGPVAEAGAVAYNTYATSQLQNKELKAKQATTAAVLAANAVQAQLDATQAQAQAELDRQKASERSDNLKIALGIGALVAAVGVTGWGLTRARRAKNPRRGRRVRRVR